MIALRRHALVRLSQAPRAGRDADRILADRWQAAGRPFVVARRGAEQDIVALGFCSVDPRHPELRPRRVAAAADPKHVVDVARPPLLAEVAENPMAGTRAATFARLAAAAEREGLDVRVYGSWMWQILTGENHVRETSDLDVLVEVADVAEADRAAAFLEREETALAFKLDGELSFPGLGEVHWREYCQGRAEIAMKSPTGLRLMPRSVLPR
ncbi:MAG: malonate decarboxylase holo-[acyl-carrier-protein] synthase [Alphaproteobacteria bacterium]|nr:malonate decarboxylase holo-[acyl-carrier-protein] synthase [Alphaproteobacteria bacterium]